MGRGRKTMTMPPKEKYRPPLKANCSAPARNLRKSDLASVIFGCKNHTIKECYFKQLFGLPAPHFSYVKNITPGLTLFLFNYSDRKLHGIFEATSYGQLNINPYGWTDDDTETPYPVQVKVRIQRRCCTLTEDQFRPIIIDNYYEQQLFWFELDRTQTSKLTSLFMSSPYNEDISCLDNTTKWTSLFYSLPTSDTRQTGDSPVLSNKGFVTGDTNFCVPEKMWSSLFKSSTQASTLTCHPLDQSNMELKSSCTPCLGRENNLLSESQGADVDAGQNCEDSETWESIWYSNSSMEVPNPLPNIPLVNDALTGETLDEDELCKTMGSQLKVSQSEESDMDLEASYFPPHLDGESQASETSTAYNAGEIYAQEKANCEVPHPSTGSSEMTSEENCENDNNHPSFADIVHLQKCSTATNSSDIQSVVVKLMQEIEGLKWSQWKQIMKICSLEHELVDSKVRIEQLKNWCYLLESGAFSSVGHPKVKYGQSDNSCPIMDKSVLLVGGFNGSSWLSSLSSYSPSCDIVTSLCHMSFLRSYASAARLNGELYIFGGIHGDVWYDTVELYNLTSNQWASRPSLNKKKGSLAGAFLCDKIFAIGGGNGVDCFSEVEMYDPNVGRWIYTQSMQYKRFSPAAAEIDNALYVVGGYDGRKYLSSVERFDPREHSWVTLRDMTSRRGCHSVAVLNEKLYALGGHDGANMVSTVEVYDPRNNTWMIGDSMNSSRGYAGAVVIGGKIYIIGGITENDEILSTIEVYKDGCGWEVTNLNAIGKRCFFSAILL